MTRGYPEAARLLGRPPHTFQHFAHRHAATFRADSPPPPAGQRRPGGQSHKERKEPPDTAAPPAQVAAAGLYWTTTVPCMNGWMVHM